MWRSNSGGVPKSYALLSASSSLYCIQIGETCEYGTTSYLQMYYVQHSRYLENWYLEAGLDLEASDFWKGNFLGLKESGFRDQSGFRDRGCRHGGCSLNPDYAVLRNVFERKTDAFSLWVKSNWKICPLIKLHHPYWEFSTQNFLHSLLHKWRIT